MSALHSRDVRGLPDERKRDVVHAVLHAEGEVAAVLLREGGRRQLHAREVHPLLGLEPASIHDLALHFLQGRAHDAQLEVAVVEEDAVAGGDVPGQGVVGRGDELLGAFDRLVGGDGHPLARAQLDGLVVLETSGADLGPGQVLQHGDRPSQVGGDLASGLHHLEVLLVLAVREVQAHDVHAGLGEALEDLALAGGRTDGRHDLRPAHAPEVWDGGAIWANVPMVVADLGFPARGVLDDSYLFHRHEAFGHHLLEDGEQALHVLLALDDLDEHGQIVRELEKVRRVQDALGSEAGDAAEHRRAREALPAEALEQRRLEGLVLPAVALADEDTDQDLVAVEDPHGRPSQPSRPRATATPSAPAARHTRRVVATLRPAMAHAPSCRYWSVS